MTSPRRGSAAKGRGAEAEADGAAEGGCRLAHLIAAVNRRLEDELAANLRQDGLPLEWFRILEALGEDGPRPMGALAEAALVERPTLTKIVDRMVAAGLVFRRPDARDRRRVHVVLSDEGEATRRRVVARAAREQERRLAERLEPGAAEAIRAILGPLA